MLASETPRAAPRSSWRQSTRRRRGRLAAKSRDARRKAGDCQARAATGGAVMCYPWSAQTQGYVYILHFDRPLGNLDNLRAQAAHYCGFAEDLPARLAKHAAGKGAKLTAAAVAQGITYHVYAWPAQLRQEQLLKAAKRT